MGGSTTDLSEGKKEPINLKVEQLKLLFLISREKIYEKNKQNLRHLHEPNQVYQFMHSGNLRRRER